MCWRSSKSSAVLDGAKVVRIDDGETGLSARTINRRLATIAGLYEYLVLLGGVTVNPVPKGLAMRRPGQRPVRGVPRYGSLGRCLGWSIPTRPMRLWRRCVPVGTGPWSKRCCWAVYVAVRSSVCACATCTPASVGIYCRRERRPPTDRADIFAVLRLLADYLEVERPSSLADRVFVVLKGPRRGQPLTAAGLDEIVAGARHRAGIERLTCHQLRHTCFTRLREAGMALEAIQAQAGHRSIESTRIYLHLANDWLAGEYRRATEAIDAQMMGEQ